MDPEKGPSSSSRNSPEPGRLLYILLYAFGFFSALCLSKLRDPNHNSGNPQYPTDSTHNTTTVGQNIRSPIHVIIDAGPPAPTPIEEKEAREERQEGRDKKKLRIEQATAFLLLLYTVVNGFMWWATKNSADAAEKAAAVAELSERPWIKIVDVKTFGNNPILPALSFQNIGPYDGFSQQATFQVIVSLKNVGHSVADVSVSYKLSLPLFNSNKYQKTITTEQERFCDSQAGSRMSQSSEKVMLFPDEAYDWSGAVESPITTNSINRLSGKGTTGYILPVVIVCANYRLKPLPANYQTKALYEVFHAEDRTRFFEIGEGIPEKRLILHRNVLADDAY